MSETSSQLTHIQEKLGASVIASIQAQGDDVVVLERKELRESFRRLKDELGFDLLSDITAVDYWQKKEPRFEVVYQIVSRAKRSRLRLRVPVPEDDPTVDSLTPLWRGANFL
jgi:NADH-quinone oxidoreductase subunit C